MKNRIDIAREIARRKAWDSLSRYKFLMFGYHAAQWVLLNDVSEDKQRNPWSSLVVLAKRISHDIEAEARARQDNLETP